MKLKDAINLIDNRHFERTAPSVWADLGCGTGLFTKALASRLSRGSKIFAVGKDKSALARIPSLNIVTVEKISADFVHEHLSLSDLDGILMANALHFVKDKISFLKKNKTCIKPQGIFLF